MKLASNGEDVVLNSLVGHQGAQFTKRILQTVIWICGRT